MKRPFLSFLLVVVLPAGASLGTAWVMAQEAWDTVQRDAHTRVARMVLAATAQELRAEENAPADSVSGTPPRAPTMVGRTTGYGTTLYLDGGRWTGTEPLTGPEALPREVATRVGPGSGLSAGDDPSAGVWLARATGDAPPRLVARAAPRSPEDSLLALPVLLVMGLLLLFGALTGWIQLARRDLHERRLALGGVVGPALVPALATLVFFIHVDRSFQEAAYEMTARDLGRGLAVAAAAGVTGNPAEVRTLTGFHATRVRNGHAEASSLPGGMTAVAALPAPPSSFTSAGTVVTPEGPSAYVALRLEERAVLVATALLPENRVAELRRMLFLAGLFLAAWWTVAAAGAWVASWKGRGAGAADESLSGEPGPPGPLRA